MNAKDIINRQTQMEKNRKPYEGLRDYCVKLAYSGRLPVSQWGSTNDRGQMTGQYIYDGTASSALDTVTNGIMSYFMPKSVNWFNNNMADRRARDMKTIRKWLQETAEGMRDSIGRSNYYDIKRFSIKDAYAIGDSYTFIDEDIKSGKVMCMLPHPRDMWVGLDYWGMVKEIHYKFDKTLSQLKGEFGDKALSEGQKTTLSKDPDQLVKVIYACYRNNDFDSSKAPQGKNRRWLAYWVVDTDGGKIIREGGYNTMNPVVWQLNKPTHEDYGRGVISQFIVEIASGNALMRDLLYASQVSAGKPMLAFDSLKGVLNLKPRGVTWIDKKMLPSGTVDIRTAVSQAVENVDYPFGMDMLERFQSLIESRLGVPFFMMLNSLEGPSKTAYEVQQLQAERAALTSPFINALQAQTDMELDRIYDIEYRAGRMPEPPQEVYELSNLTIDIEYTGPIIQILRTFYQKSSLYAVLQDMAQVYQIDPNALINLDLDVITQELLKNDNCPEDAIKDLKDVRQIRAMIAQQQETAQAAALAEQTAKILPSMQKAPDEGSLIKAMMRAA